MHLSTDEEDDTDEMRLAGSLMEELRMRLSTDEEDDTDECGSQARQWKSRECAYLQTFLPEAGENEFTDVMRLPGSPMVELRMRLSTDLPAGGR